MDVTCFDNTYLLPPCALSIKRREDVRFDFLSISLKYKITLVRVSDTHRQQTEASALCSLPLGLMTNLMLLSMPYAITWNEPLRIDRLGVI